jgi:hypothetical protein
LIFVFRATEVPHQWHGAEFVAGTQDTSGDVAMVDRKERMGEGGFDASAGGCRDTHHPAGHRIAEQALDAAAGDLTALVVKAAHDIADLQGFDRPAVNRCSGWKALINHQQLEVLRLEQIQPPGQGGDRGHLHRRPQIHRAAGGDQAVFHPQCREGAGGLLQ